MEVNKKENVMLIMLSLPGGGVMTYIDDISVGLFASIRMLYILEQIAAHPSIVTLN